MSFAALLCDLDFGIFDTLADTPDFRNRRNNWLNF
jgi:hypothetical protein